MCEIICVTLASGRKLCIKIPLYIYARPQWWPPNPPDPLAQLGHTAFGPVPDPWVQLEGFRSEVESDLRMLATLHAASGALSRELRGPIQKALRLQAEKLPLPEGVSIEFGQLEREAG